MVGVVEPVPRDEAYCDPPALFHVSGDYSFIRYFTRTIYQFQFQKALCDEAGHIGSLFKCDITNSTAAGTKLRNMLELGRSQSWTRALETITGSVTKMDAAPLLEYFEDLRVWLEEDNKKNNRTVGWKNTIDPYSKDTYKVRISLKSAMGDKAYTWNGNEMYLFRANMAYAMRQYYSQKNMSIPFTSENICTYKETPRISFYFLVTHPTSVSTIIPKEDVEAAIKLSRDRINNAFGLDDKTLEFEGLLATLAPPVEQPFTIWLVVFGVVMGVVTLMGVYLVVSGVRERKKKAAAQAAVPAENPYDTTVDGAANKTYEKDEGEQNECRF